VDLRTALNYCSEYSTHAICVIGVLHLLFFFGLWLAFRGRLRRLAAMLDDFTRGLRQRSVLDRSAHLTDQIEAFLADVHEVLQHPERIEERRSLLDRMRILDEKRRYLQSMSFDTWYNVARSMIEAYPLMGILGTILAIGLVVAEGDKASVSAIVLGFGQAIWSTCAGIVLALVLMLLNSFVEPGFIRLMEQQRLVRETISRVKGFLGERTPSQPPGGGGA
jgi:biopolymer transport protein ExbB